MTLTKVSEQLVELDSLTVAAAGGNPVLIDTAGRVAFGSAIANGERLRISAPLAGAVTARGTNISSNVQSDVTTAATVYNSFVGTAAASFTLPVLTHYSANQGTIGAGSTVTVQYGFLATSSLTGAASNYGFYGNIAAGSGRWNFYANGTAANYFAGNVGIGTTTITTYTGQTTLALGGSTGGNIDLVSGTTLAGFFGNDANHVEVGAYGNRYIGILTNSVERMRFKGNGAIRFVPIASAPSSPQAGDVYYDSGTNKLRVHNGSAWVDLH